MSVISDLEEARPLGKSRRTIEAIADAFARRVGYNPEMQLGEVVDQFGGRISYRDYAEHSDAGSIEVYGRSDFTVFIPTHTSAAENRVIVGHELGHYILHFIMPRSVGRDAPSSLIAFRYGTGPAEDEANWFAPAFLIPAEQLREALRADPARTELEARFKVPSLILEARLAELASKAD